MVALYWPRYVTLKNINFLSQLLWVTISHGPIFYHPTNFYYYCVFDEALKTARPLLYDKKNKKKKNIYNWKSLSC